MKVSTPSLDLLKRGISGYMSYLAACQMWGVFTEYILYEPINRMLIATGWKVHCEYKIPGLKTGHSGEIDFVASRTQNREQDEGGETVEFAMEVKWKKTQQTNFEVSRDYEKLILFRTKKPNADLLICVFGREIAIAECQLYLSKKSMKEHDLQQQPNFENVGKTIIAKLGKTSYGCRIFRLT